MCGQRFIASLFSPFPSLKPRLWPHFQLVVLRRLNFRKNKILQCRCRHFSVCLIKPILCMYLTKCHVSGFFPFRYHPCFFFGPVLNWIALWSILKSCWLNKGKLHFLFFCFVFLYLMLRNIYGSWQVSRSTRQAKLNQVSYILPSCYQSFCSFLKKVLKKSLIVVK